MGTATAVFETSEDALQAVNKLDGLEIEGLVISVSLNSSDNTNRTGPRNKQHHVHRRDVDNSSSFSTLSSDPILHHQIIKSNDLEDGEEYEQQLQDNKPLDSRLGPSVVPVIDRLGPPPSSSSSILSRLGDPIFNSHSSSTFSRTDSTSHSNRAPNSHRHYNVNTFEKEGFTKERGGRLGRAPATKSALDEELDAFMQNPEELAYDPDAEAEKLKQEQEEIQRRRSESQYHSRPKRHQERIDYDKPKDDDQIHLASHALGNRQLLNYGDDDEF